ncbi:NAD(P)-dependent oxidoreductase [Variovorax sp. UMC13]|uniref:NAD(P)-dependent oxidoreductase n=1 Tax=Variovorax sp. UMC13 TaxID=1862326 RepID=UPI0016049D61|nr:NAD(P)-dependent oxidoreductase [Variovorax sp. UMC13]MBB1600936.1 hydroxyacid dehydrogenase [Variovorax sp. UMC13]
MTLPRVLLTDPLHPDARARLATWAEIAQLPDGLSRAQSDAALREAVRQAEGLVVRRLLPTDLFDGPNALRCVMRQGVGLDFIPVERATAKGIPVGNTPAVNANAVAEYVFAALLAHSRQLAAFDASVRAGDWAARAQAGARTYELRGRTLGLIGYGAIGQRIGAIAMQGFGMALAVCTGTPSKVPAGIATLTIEALFAASDVVVIACPLTPQTRGLVNAAVLAHAKPGAVLVNVGRGPVLREDDLAAALAEGRLAGAVLDVFQTQPLPADSALRRHPGVLLTPHLAGLTQEAERAMGLMAVDTLAAVLLRGEQPPHIVNPEVFARPSTAGA